MSDEGGSLSYNATLVLAVVERGCRYGLEVIDHTGLSPGTVYPALRRLEAAGLVEGTWEDEAAAHEAGRPARRNYGITEAGRGALAEAMERVRAQQAALGWLPEGNA